MPRVYSRRKGTEPPPPGAVYIGRGTPYGNPFVMEREADRPAVIAAFRRYALDRLVREPHWLDPLIGKDLLCFCHPLPCHGDVVLELLAARQEQQPDSATSG